MLKVALVLVVSTSPPRHTPSERRRWEMDTHLVAVLENVWDQLDDMFHSLRKETRHLRDLS